MGKLSLSPNVIEGIEIINSIDENQLSGIVQYIRDMQVGESAKNVVDYFKSSLGIEAADVVFPAIINLINFIQKNKDKNALEDILESLKSLEPKREFDLVKLRSSFTEILDNSKNIILTTKAASLLVANNNNFSECKIVTDIRLVFDENITLSKRNAVIVHKLHFEVSNPTNSEDIFIHMDMEDLVKLKEAVDRAILKEELIKEDYEEINFISLNQ